MAVDQRSFTQGNTACLYLCSTPIGNLQDVTFRLLDVLKTADVVLAEDTRQTRKLLTHFDLHVERLVSYHQHNEQARTQDLIHWWEDGLSVALVSDAGTPAISDPGYHAVQLAVEQGVPVVPIPGASAVLAALVASGLAPQPFAFYGFPPRSAGALDKFAGDISALQMTVVLYESPHRVAQTLAVLARHCPDRPITLARELTKRYESFLRGTVESVLAHVQAAEVKGECVLILGPAPVVETAVDEAAKLAQAIAIVAQKRAEGWSHKQAVAHAVEQTGVRRRELYQQTLNAE